MKKVFFYILLAVAFTACNNETATTEASEENAVETTQEGIAVDNLLDNIENMVGQEVTVFGTVDHVCKHGGGKMVIYTGDPDKGIHIDATDESGKFRGDELMDEMVAVVGTVDEFVVDDGYIAEKEAKLEEMKAEQGDDAEEVAEEHESKEIHKGNAPDNDGKHKKQIKGLEDQIASLKEELAKAKEEGKDHLSFYSVKCISYKVVESDEEAEESAAEEANETVGHQESAVENEAEETK